MEKLASLFRSQFGVAPSSVVQMCGAGSNRRYYRLTAGEVRAVGVCGVSAEENRAFIYLTRHFSNLGQPVPQFYNMSEDGMCYLQEDLGSYALYDAMANARARDYIYGAKEEKLLERTLRALARLQTEGAKGLEEAQLLSPRRMDVRAAMFDLNYFKYMFLRVQDINVDELLLEDDMLRLAKDLCGTPCDTFLYRDFQARNVMLTNNDEPRFIDYQSGRLGPLQYDVASFLWQASARYPDDLKERLIMAYLDELNQVMPTDEDEFLNKLNGFVLLRTLQVLGAYGLRGIVERKEYFLHSIPSALANLSSLLQQGVCRPYPYLQDTLSHLCEKVSTK